MGSSEHDVPQPLHLPAQNDITEAFPDLTFAAESDFFGRKELQELVPGGKDIRVTEANKRQYVDLIAHHHMTTSIRDQINAFLAGFWELIPRCAGSRARGFG
jgi:E3 ubiquitin-protein ligase HUWE1